MDGRADARPIEIDGDEFEFPTAALPDDGRDARHAVKLTRSTIVEGARDGWCVLGASPNLRVNGERVLAGLKVLTDRDELSLGTRRAFVSTERIASPVAYRAESRAVTCPRCGDPVRDGELVVHCPQCGLAHHHIDVPGVRAMDDPGATDSCWLNDRTCAECSQDTALGEDVRWSPSNAEGEGDR